MCVAINSIFLWCLRVKNQTSIDTWAPFAPRKSQAFETHLDKVQRDLCHKLIVVVGSRCSCVGQSIRSPAVFARKMTGRT